MRFKTALFAAIVVITLVRDGPSAGFSPQDFYFSDASGRVEKLVLYPKIFVRFKSAEAVGNFDKVFAKLPAVKTKESTKYPGATLSVSFAENLNSEDLLKVVRDINASGLAEARPVFLVENIEVVVDGFFVEPRTFVTAASLEKRMKIYGEFEAIIEQAPSLLENGLFRFKILNIKEPLNIFLLMNFARQDNWVKRAYPEFMFLHEPITASFSVDPPSGTIGEERRLILEVKIFDPAIKLRDDLMPGFGAGKFVPMVDAKLPPSHLFEAVGEKTKDESVTERGRVIKITWRFKQFSVGLAQISDQPVPVPYEKNGSLEKTNALTVRLATASLVKDMDIQEMPAAKILKPINLGIASASVKPVLLPVYWFDFLPVYPKTLAYTGLALAVFSGATAFVFALALLLFVVQARYARAKKEESLFREVESICSMSSIIPNPDRGQFKLVEDTFYRVLSTAFPQLSKHPTRKEIKEAKLGRNDINAAFDCLEKTYAPDFKAQTEDLSAFSAAVSGLLKRFEKEIKRSFR